MNILIYCHIQLWEAHHAEAIEIALSHMKMGHRVFMLSCFGDLTSCPANSLHELSKCSVCNKNTRYALDKILGGGVVNIKLDLTNASRDESGDDLPCFNNFEQLKSYVEHGVPFGSLVASQLVDNLQDCFADLVPFASQINGLISNGRSLYSEAVRQIRINKISKVYVWNGRRISDGPVFYAAKNEGVDCDVYISGGKPGTYMTIPAPTVMDLCANKSRINSLISQNKEFLNDSVFVQEASIFYNTQRYGGAYFPGSVQFSKTFKKNLAPAPDGRKRLVIFTSSYWEFIAVDTFSGGLYENHYAGLRRILDDEGLRRDYSIVVRWHPNLRNCGSVERKIIDDIIKSGDMVGVANFSPDSEVDSYELLEQSDVVVTFGSTIGAEACYYGKPSVLLGRSWYEDLNLAYVPKSHEDLLCLLRGNLLPKPRFGSLVYGYYMRNFGNNEFKHLSYGADCFFRFESRRIHPVGLLSRLKGLFLGGFVGWVKNRLLNFFHESLCKFVKCMKKI